MKYLIALALVAVCSTADACPLPSGHLLHRAVSRVRSLSACPSLQRSVAVTQACQTVATRTVMKAVVTPVESTVLVPETKMVPKTIVTNKLTYVPTTETVVVPAPVNRTVTRSRLLFR